MEFEKAIYSYSAMDIAISMCKSLNVTVSRKNQHFAKAMELKELYSFCENNINSMLFEFDCTPIKEYFNASYNFKNYKKSELDNLLKQAKNYLKRELHSIYNDMVRGELLTTD